MFYCMHFSGFSEKEGSVYTLLSATIHRRLAFDKKYTKNDTFAVVNKSCAVSLLTLQSDLNSHAIGGHYQPANKTSLIWRLTARWI